MPFTWAALAGSHFAVAFVAAYARVRALGRLAAAASTSAEARNLQH